MKNKLFCLLIVMALLSAPMALAQEQQMASVLTVHTKLGHGQHYEGLLAKIFAAFKKHGVDRPIQVSTSTSDPGAYSFLMMFSDWAEFGAINAKIQQAYASIPEVMQETQGTFTHSEQSIWAMRSDLAYQPAKPRIGAGEAGFTRLTFFYPHPEHALAFEGMMKEFQALNKKHGNPNATNAAALIMGGAEWPAYVVAGAGKSQADLFAEGAKWQGKMQAEWNALAAKAGPMLKHIEYSSSTPRPDLSYSP